jgi:hypothetical protein
MGTASLALRQPPWPTNLPATPGIFQLPSAAFPGYGIIEWYATLLTAPRVLEISLVGTTASTTTVALGRPEKTAYQPTTVLFQADDPADYSPHCRGAVSWTIPPWTVSGNIAANPWIRKAAFINIIGSGVVWTFPRGLKILPGGSLMVTNLTNASSNLLDISCSIEE